jgi:hypothetical protein
MILVTMKESYTSSSRRQVETSLTGKHMTARRLVGRLAAGILVAGDALNGTDGTVDGPSPAFSEDMTVARQSVVKLAGFDYEVALFGHGEPLLEGASTAVGALASG